jgi:hypothetical protein
MDFKKEEFKSGFMRLVKWTGFEITESNEEFSMILGNIFKSI